MKKTKLETLIERKAGEKLVQEYKDFRQNLMGNKIGSKLEINGERIWGYDNHGILPEYMPKKTIEGSNIFELLQERKEEIIGEETENLLNKLSSLDYLFNQ